MKTVKVIGVDVNKCNGCLSCEMTCSASHSTPAYSSVNPARSRIRVTMDETRDIYLPVRAAEFAPAECLGRNDYVIDGKEYEQCSFCPASCPSRSRFTDPDTGLPMKCDMCESLEVDEPLCVQVCHPGALSYAEHQVEETGVAQSPRGEQEIGVEFLADRYGMQNLVEAVARLGRKKR